MRPAICACLARRARRNAPRESAEEDFRAGAELAPIVAADDDAPPKALEPPRKAAPPPSAFPPPLREEQKALVDDDVEAPAPRAAHAPVVRTAARVAEAVAAALRAHERAAGAEDPELVEASNEVLQAHAEEIKGVRRDLETHVETLRSGAAERAARRRETEDRVRRMRERVDRERAKLASRPPRPPAVEASSDDDSEATPEAHARLRGALGGTEAAERAPEPPPAPAPPPAAPPPATPEASDSDDSGDDWGGAKPRDLRAWS